LREKFPNQRHFFQQFEVSDLDSIQFAVSGKMISKVESQLLLSNIFGNENVERLFLKCLKSNIDLNVSTLKIENRIDLESVEAPDGLLLNESVMVESPSFYGLL
jgi:hypothetical protein